MIESILYTSKNYKDILQSQQKNAYTNKMFKEVVEHPMRISVFGAVRKIREQRMQMVKLECQYCFIYSYMERWIEKNAHKI